MAKKRRISRRRGFFSKLRTRAKKSYKSGKMSLTTAAKTAVKGAIGYLGISYLANYVPFGLDARMKRILIFGLAILFGSKVPMIGGIIAAGGLVGLSIEAASILAPYMQGLFQGQLYQYENI
jgi:hypothetical protein